MASQQAAKPLHKKILDPTKIPTWKVARRPPIENHSIIQGKPREQNSNAFKDHQSKEGTRLRKALNAITHGKNIFVYHNIRTNQVVYSLTRYLEKNSVLRQLVYHGKKTIPATVRKDMWVPYYSVHFNDSKIGLRAYHLLREFAMQRQLSPPKEMITVNQEYLDQKRPRDPEQAKEFDEKHKGRIGWFMEKKERARVLMDQKATSVADIAAVIEIQESELKDGFANGLRGYLTPSARRRRRQARQKEQAKAEEQAARVANFEQTLSTNQVEYKIQEIEDKTGALENNGVKILWTDIHDARRAESWSDRVQHGELELSRDHVMPGQKRNYDQEVLADSSFEEKKA
ncbi:hypothetical protein P170DRAFT_392437 [Aspergillus steynii IBT 23096]|uniref:Large ribosomal subunit protein mL67 n=1 Tax=Aspergillus steynii IBT 23096 TaxID=1392250 RepID=A0A2I2FUI9_9EURO|nr:uncharacterized protein P170DRAFT_392437 [Aspergillus steynii IBT 23096]PLB44292.1 hypothetical protein P170DRAFT_392437 [Aspergillus steynii IBT 23096]